MIYIVAHPSFWNSLPNDRFLACGRVKRVDPHDFDRADAHNCAKFFTTKSEAVAHAIATNCHVISFVPRDDYEIDIQLLLDFAKK